MAKRMLDVTVGAIAALVALPVIAVLAVASMVSLRTWNPIFVQHRVGRHGKLFRLPKIRTLPVWTPRYADKYAIQGIPTTRLCRFMRATHLDELPQLLLVPIGKMSLVGPRPEMPALLESWDPELVKARHQVRPGLTGPWQVSRDAAGLIGESPEYDLHYAGNANLRLDLWILWKTGKVMVTGPSGLVDANVVRGRLGLISAPESLLHPGRPEDLRPIAAAEAPA